MYASMSFEEATPLMLWLCCGKWLAEEIGSRRGTVVATDCARRGIGSTGEKWTSFVAVPVVSGLSITAGVGSKESEGDLRRAMAIPFGVLGSVIGAAERKVSSTRLPNCGLAAEAAVVDKCRDLDKCDNCPDEMVLVEAYM
jgi:hypothetical protein